MTNLLTNRFSLIYAVKRKMTALIMVTIALFSGACFAIPPVTITGPSPAIPGHIPSGTTNTYTFTITNNVPLAFPLSISPVQAPITRTTVANDCGNSLPAESSCNIGFTVAPTTIDEGISIIQPLVINYQGRTSITQLIEFIVPSSPVLTAVGYQNAGTGFLPYIASNPDGNSGSWASTFIGSGPAIYSASFNASSCTGSGASALCVVVGNIGDTNGAIQVSRDAGLTWTPINTPNGATFASVSCIGSSATGICVAAGQIYDQNNNAEPLIYTSQDGGKTWNDTTPTFPPGAQKLKGLNSVSCTGSEATPLCVIVGNSFSTGGAGGALMSTNGTVWKSATFPTGSDKPEFPLNSVSCIGYGTSGLCLAGGDAPGLYFSTNSGINWTKATLPGNNQFTQFASVSCTGTSTNNFCVAASLHTSIFSGVFKPNFTITNTFTSADVEGFVGASCTGSGPSTVCVAAANGAVGSSGTKLFVTKGLGGNWIAPGNTQNPNGNLTGATCTGIGSSAICFAVGATFVGSIATPLIIQNNGDVTAPWVQLTPAGAPFNSQFNGSGATE